MSQKVTNATQIFINTNDSDFRSWIDFIGANLELGGVIKTTDTGQINRATVLKPAAASTSQGYEIRRFSDTLQATKPVFMKIEYGSTSAATVPGLWITLGTGSDGAGNITGTFLARTQILTGAGAGSASVPARISVDTGRFNFGFNYLTNAGSAAVMLVSIERTKNAALADEGTGLLTAFPTSNAVAGFTYRVLPFTGTAPTPELTGGAVHPGTDTTLAGADVGIYPPNPTYFGYRVYPGLNFFCYRTSEILADSVVTIDVDGTNHDYVATNQRHNISERTVNSPGMLMRYE